MARKTDPVTPRIAGPVDLEGKTRFPIGGSTSLDCVYAVHRLVFGKDSFLVVLYGAQNVGGLIGTEYNGVAVIWESKCGRVVLTDHFRDNSCMKASERQHKEYRRICAMDRAMFRSFINGHKSARCRVLITKPAPILKSRVKYIHTRFTATEFASAADKQQFFEALILFLCNHCDEDRFTDLVYKGLSLNLGHIAHYNRAGFYEEWFADYPARIHFLRRHSRDQVYGGWRDVAEAFKAWIDGPEGQAVLGHWRTQLTTMFNPINHQ